MRSIRQALAGVLCAWTGVWAASPVVTCSSTILADWAQVLAGDQAAVQTLAGANTDLHAYQPSPLDVRKLIQSDIIVGIDPSLEPWLEQLVKSNNLTGKVLWIGAPWISHSGKVAHICDDPTHDHGTAPASEAQTDPHLWMDPALVQAMVSALSVRLEGLPGVDAASIRARRAGYLREVRALDASIRETFDAIPAGRRVIVTHHGNLARFADRYDIRIAGVILRSSSTEAADPSARTLAELVRRSREAGVRAVVRDRGQRAPAASALAREAGLPEPLELSVDSLDTPGSPSGTWLGLMRENTRRLAEAMSRP